MGRAVRETTVNGAITGGVEALASLVERHHLKLVHLIELDCAHCGVFRVEAASPAAALDCPQCGTERPAIALGDCYARRSAPLVRHMLRSSPWASGQLVDDRKWAGALAGLDTWG